MPDNLGRYDLTEHHGRSAGIYCPHCQEPCAFYHFDTETLLCMGCALRGRRRIEEVIAVDRETFKACVMNKIRPIIDELRRERPSGWDAPPF